MNLSQPQSQHPIPRELTNLPNFNIDEISSSDLHSYVHKEVQSIYDGIYSRNNRSWDRIMYDTALGHAAELFLLKTQNFTENPLPYNDIISPMGHFVEVKVVDSKWCNEYRIETDPKKMNLKLWTEKYKSNVHDNASRYVVVYSVHDGKYTYFKTYDLDN